MMNVPVKNQGDINRFHLLKCVKMPLDYTANSCLIWSSKANFHVLKEKLQSSKSQQSLLMTSGILDKLIKSTFLRCLPVSDRNIKTHM